LLGGRLRGDDGSQCEQEQERPEAAAHGGGEYRMQALRSCHAVCGRAGLQSNFHGNRDAGRSF
jgi:hypothetical protein